MNDRKWFDRSQPQMLQLSTILLYFNCVWILLGLLSGGIALLGLVLLGGQFFGAVGIANDHKKGYIVACVVSVLALAYTVLLYIAFHVGIGIGIINLIFEIVLVLALLHPQSREYQRIWFR